jgi:hypothetical protein
MISLSTSYFAIALMVSSFAKVQASVAEVVADLRLAPGEADRFQLLDDSEVR